MNSRVLVVVKGKIQGVYFRASTLAEAGSLHICGYVKNLNDGSVEIDAEFEKERKCGTKVTPIYS